MRYHNSVSSLPQPFDLFRGQKRNNRRDMEERIAKHFSNASVRSASGQKVSTLSWSTDGASCILGCVEGGMEVWDEEVLALRKDLDYQQQSPMSIGALLSCLTSLEQ